MADITEKPNGTVSGLGAPKRGSGEDLYKLTAKWSTTSYMKSNDNPRRIQGFDLHWTFKLKNIDSGSTKTLEYKRRSADPNRTDWVLDLNNFKCEDGKTYTRSSFYPVSGYWTIQSVTVKVRGYNSKGEGSWVSATRQFYDPRKPEITKIEQVADTGAVKMTLKQDQGKDFHDNHSSHVWVDVYDHAQKKKLPECHHDWYPTSSNTSVDYQIADIYSRMRQSYSEWMRVDVAAISRGLHGKTDTVRSQLFVSWPQQPTITSVNISNRNKTTAKVTFNIETGYHPYNEATTGVKNPHPTTGVRLEKLANVLYEDALDIPGDVSWDECGAVDNGVCNALSSTVAELQPERGKITWVRVKSWNQVEDIFFRYSEPMRMKKLERKPITTTGDTAEIIDAISGDDGVSAVITAGWPNDESTGTEFSWSESPNAWRSTDEPDTYQASWDDGSVTIGTGQSAITYPHTAKLYVAGLTEGTTYHFRVRRYKVDAEDNTLYGPYWPEDATIQVTPTSSPRSVTLSAPQFVRRGSGVSLAWTYDSDAEQRHWELITGTTTTTTSSDGIEHLWIDEADTTSGSSVTAATVQIVASGDDASGSYVIDAERLASLVGNGTSIPLAVRVSTGGEMVTSEAVSVNVADLPTVSITTANVTAQPMSFSVACSTNAELTVVVRSQYVSSGYAGGVITQTEGDCTWSTVVTPAWTYANGTYTATVTAPDGLSLMDGGSYTVTVKATDPTTRLSSEDATGMFDVEYAHRAPMPSVTSVVASDVTDTSGMRVRSAVITLASPTGAASGDVYDVYRMTPDGPQLCAEGVPLASVVTDPWAPYGKRAQLAYRVSCRTVDGVEEWMDYPYQLGGIDLRVDFGGEYVELPYDLNQSDDYEKDFEARKHLDGSIDGYWNQGVARTASLTTNIVKLRDEDRIRAVRRLAAYSGPCYVRCPDGSAYQANVSVGGLSRQEGSFAVAVSLTATQVELTDYLAVTPAEEEEEEE